MNILNLLKEERQNGLKGALYHKTQVTLCYNSNRIEGTKLSEEQTRYIFETKTIGFNTDGLPVDDIVETANHFRAFDHMLDTIAEPLNTIIIKQYHQILKSGTSQSTQAYFNVGGWKTIPNEVGGQETTPPKEVENEIQKLLQTYHTKNIGFDDVVQFHVDFEQIHPFQDGNGRVGRLIIFRELLKNNLVPLIIDEKHKLFYYRGIKEYSTTKGYLTDTLLSAQDTYKTWVAYFYPNEIEA